VVLITSRRTLETRRGRLRRALAAIEHGLRDTLDDPEAAAREIARAAETRDVDLIRAQLRAVTPVFARGLRLDPRVIDRWADFDARIGIVDDRPDVPRAFEFGLVGAG
jgi:putative hydroxymethylpyrimidine transport system substrate-binding protein